VSSSEQNKEESSYKLHQCIKMRWWNVCSFSIGAACTRGFKCPPQIKISRIEINTLLGCTSKTVCRHIWYKIFFLVLKRQNLYLNCVHTDTSCTQSAINTTVS
jgi:hypothetical protein